MVESRLINTDPILSFGTYAFCCLPIICGITFLIWFVITQLASLYKTDSKLIGLKFAAKVGSFSHFLRNLKIAVLRIIYLSSPKGFFGPIS